MHELMQNGSVVAVRHCTGNPSIMIAARAEDKVHAKSKGKPMEIRMPSIRYLSV